MGVIILEDAFIMLNIPSCFFAFAYVTVQKVSVCCVNMVQRFKVRLRLVESLDYILRWIVCHNSIVQQGTAQLSNPISSANDGHRWAD